MKKQKVRLRIDSRRVTPTQKPKAPVNEAKKEEAPQPEAPIKNRFGFLNVPHFVCTHLLGEHHSETHRMVVGVMVMVMGVVISKSMGHSPNLFLHYGADTLGYAIHGIGAIPFVERVSQMGR